MKRYAAFYYIPIHYRLNIELFTQNFYNYNDVDFALCISCQYIIITLKHDLEDVSKINSKLSPKWLLILVKWNFK